MDMIRACDISELKQLSHPPVVVKNVVQTMLLLLGEDVAKTDDWSYCQFQMRSEFIKRLLRFNVSKVHPEIWSAAKHRMRGISEEQVRKNNLAAAGLFFWIKAVVNHCESMYDPSSDDELPTPAGMVRQKIILRKHRKHKLRRDVKHIPHDTSYYKR